VIERMFYEGTTTAECERELAALAPHIVKTLRTFSDEPFPVFGAVAARRIPLGTMPAYDAKGRPFPAQIFELTTPNGVPEFIQIDIALIEANAEQVVQFVQAELHAVAESILANAEDN
jgi:hypothetical protein